MNSADLLEWIYASGRLQIMAVACELDLFEHLAERPRGPDDLAAATGAQLAPLQALLDACVAMDLLRWDGARYYNRPLAQAHLVANAPVDLRELIHIFQVESPRWTGLRDLVIHGRVPDMDTDSEPRRFTLGMHALGLVGEAAALAARVPLAGRRTLTDVGCGSGVYSISLCQENPRLLSTGLDQPEVLETTAGIVEASPCADRIRLRPADIEADDYGSDQDVVLLSDVLYGSEAACCERIAMARRALVAGGLLIVRGYFSVPDSGQPLFGALFDLARLLRDTGRAPITVQALCGWVAEAGFRDVQTFALTERSTCLLAERT